MRKLSLRISLFCAVVTACGVLPAQQTTTVSVIIRVTDPSGAGIPRAQVRLVPSPESGPARLGTDDHGQLLLNLKAGGYALFVSAPAFRKDTRHVDISIPAGQTGANQIVPVVLQVGSYSGPEVYAGMAVEGSLLLTADPYHAPVVLSPADFHALPHTTVTVRNSHANASETYSGVPLATLLAKVNAPMGKELHGEAMTSYLIATGSDGYSVVLSLAEVDPDFHGGQVLVADTRDGQPLGKNGPFQLIVSDDKRPARWVHNLNSITLLHAR